MTKVKKCCEGCGSENVWVDANARWDIETQQYELASLFDDEYCDDCDGKTTIIEVDLAEEPAGDKPSERED